MLELGWLHFGITQALCLALSTVVLLYFIYGRGKRYNLPPGPTPLPIIGNVLLFARSKKNVPLEMTDLAKTYGPIYHLRFGFMRTVVLNNYELAKEALLTKPTEFAGRPRSYSMDIITEGGKDIALSDYGPTWRLQRKIASKALRKYLSGSELEKRVHKAFGEGAINALAAEKGLFNPREHISYAVVSFISAFCFGESHADKDSLAVKMLKFSDFFLEVSANGLPEDFLPALRHLRLKKSQIFRDYVKGVLDDLYKLYKEHEISFDPDNIRDFTDCLIAAEREARTEEAPADLAQLSNTHFVQTLSDIFAAGIDTSRFTLCWAIIYLVAFPDVQEKAFKEIENVVGTSRLPGMDDRKSLRYTEAVLFESMRLRPVTPVGVPHAAIKDEQLGGYDIPKGTMVMINQWALHHDPEFWKDPEEFRPERFLEADGTPAPKPDNFLPFSMGRRVCLGEVVAKPELLLILAIFIQKFRFLKVPGEKLCLDPAGGIGGFVPHPYNVIVESRN